MNQKLEKIIRRFSLKPLEMEGGYYCETYRSEQLLENQQRSLSTAIYYLLTPDTYSCLHRLPGDEIYHFYCGDPVELLVALPNEEPKQILLGNPVEGEFECQYVVPGGSIQGSRLKAGGEFALMGTTMSPGFDFKDFQVPSSNELQPYKSHSLWSFISGLQP